MVKLKRQKVSKVTKLATTEEYVYDISMKHQGPFFFANGHLVHNTDSAYFSAWPVLKDKIEKENLNWNVDTIIEIYDSVADDVNESFPHFMNKAFHCPKSYGNLIKCGREVVGSTGLFITKKRYAIMVIDKEGKRLDVDGKPGKVKAMGLDLKRSDTPVIVQNFLSKILEMTLLGATKEDIIDEILKFKEEFRSLPPWEKGSPTRINNLSKYTLLEDRAKQKGEKTKLPGHVRAAYNYNKLRDLNNDKFSMKLTDGSKAIVCKLKDNSLGITSIAIPTDENNIPQWFKDLPFDDDAMEAANVTQKVENLLGVLGWDLDVYTDTSNTFGSFFK